ncbi:hypothetical protein ACFYTG_55835 [Streptomyces mirabilis]|uniref:hypothetical protein n=1 Tax=Streptomyces mirabilis TaxID=68239 RepID=UPI0036D200FA
MEWRILEWATLVVMAALLVLGVRMATGTSRRGRPGARRNGTFLILISLSSLAGQLPHMLGWPHSIALALDPAALLLAVAGLVVVTGPWAGRRSKQQERG